jgi:hypothetical protein
MPVDTYTRTVLTVIALCLVYLCARDAAPRVSAQDAPAPTRVVITGVTLDQPIRVRVADPVDIRTAQPIKIEADDPIPVRAIREPGTQRPGPDNR